MRYNLKKILLFLIVSIITISSVQNVFCLAEENSDNVFIVGFDAEFLPYGYKDENGAI